MLRRARLDDLEPVFTLLESDALPTAGVVEAFEHFRVVEIRDRVVAVAGLEIHGPDGILRSVAVHPSVRGCGWGGRLTRAMVDTARDARLKRLYLLTTSAAGYFPRFGFRRTERGEAPDAIRSSVEFAEACPASAVAMVLDLDADPPLEPVSAS